MENIIIEHGCFKRECSKLNIDLIICDDNLTLDIENIAIEYVKSGEEKKNEQMLFECLQLLHKYNLNRNQVVMIVGGGVLIDVCSLAANLYKRGINYINVPTTTLSMIDSSVGGKNGINLYGIKNLIGTFGQAQKVIIDTDFLKTLSKRDYNNGIAEAIKIGMLSNPQIITELNKNDYEIKQVIKLAVLEKQKYVSADKYDHTIRNRLNFGHTFGHAIEAYYDYKRYLHGEAVSIGMVIASAYDPKLIKLLRKFDLPTLLASDIDVDKLISYMQVDKKNKQNGLINWITLEGSENLTPAKIKQKLDFQLKLDNKPLTSEFTVNRSKSYIHRYLLAALAFKSKITIKLNELEDYSQDVIQSINILRQCGAIIKTTKTELKVDAREIKKPQQAIEIYRSATTYRMFTPTLCMLFGSVDIKLCEQLQKRPHPIFEKYRSGDSHKIEFNETNYQLDGSLSSQFISGYCFALAAALKASKITITGELTSRPYIEMTLDVLSEFGIDIELNENVISIVNNAKCTPTTVDPQVDFSSLANLIVYNRLAQINNLQALSLTVPTSSHQADFAITKVLDKEVIDMSNNPDLLPILVIYGLFNKRGVKLINTSRIRYKECDRIEAMRVNLQKLGIAIKVKEDSVEVLPIKQLTGGLINTFGDHRIGFAFAIASSFCSAPIIIDDYRASAKSYPRFYMQLLGER